MKLNIAREVAYILPHHPPEVSVAQRVPRGTDLTFSMFGQGRVAALSGAGRYPEIGRGGHPGAQGFAAGDRGAEPGPIPKVRGSGLGPGAGGRAPGRRGAGGRVAGPRRG